MTATTPGRLGDPTRSIGTDPRTDPRLRSALAAFGLDAPAAPAPLSPTSPREELLAFCDAAEKRMEALIAACYADVVEIPGVERQTLTARGTDGHEIALYLHRPIDASGPLPGLVHFHGGGMVFLEASGVAYRAWRDRLAAGGLVVVGVEFRNGGGKQGPHPYPTGLDDCAEATRWVSANRTQLSISHLVLSGESGGGTFTLATALRANRAGWIDELAGLYALGPYLRDARDTAGALPSMRENDGYVIGQDTFGLLAEIYDPESKHAREVTCWPYNAAESDLAGLPPTVVSVNELDLLRDEGLEFYRRLVSAGVAAVGRVVPGTCHGADVAFGAALPDVQAATLRDIVGFARSVG